MDYVTKIQDYIVECNSNDLIQSMLKLLENFYSNKPEENIIMVVILTS